MSMSVGESPVAAPPPTPIEAPSAPTPEATPTPSAAAPEATPTPSAASPEATPTPQQMERQRDGFDDAISAVNKGANGVKSVTDSLTAMNTDITSGQPNNTRSNRIVGGVGAAASAAQLPGAAFTAFRDGRDALNDPSAENITKAVGSGASALSTAANTAKGAIETNNLVRNFNGIRDAAARAMTEAAPDAAREVVDRVARETAQNVLDGASRQVTRAAAAQAAENGLEAAARAGAGAARAAAPQVAAATAGRAAARFVPGLNVGMAVADSAAFGAEVANAWRTGQPNVGKLATSGITALGSIAAATNIPIVSQTGAVVSTVSSFVGSFF